MVHRKTEVVCLRYAGATSAGNHLEVLVNDMTHIMNALGREGFLSITVVHE